ncbi:MAG: hypothetical protein HGA85_04940 [Nanoarchaeota archaeon]|nr:hypothetical protein [Nanoarchaeota archaeon]
MLKKYFDYKTHIKKVLITFICLELIAIFFSFGYRCIGGCPVPIFAIIITSVSLFLVSFPIVSAFLFFRSFSLFVQIGIFIGLLVGGYFSIRHLATLVCKGECLEQFLPIAIFLVSITLGGLLGKAISLIKR